MGRTIGYYMALPYMVELECGRIESRASVKELPGCKATVKPSESVEELWKLLKEDQRRRIEELLEFGDEVSEPASVSVDPFWESFPDDIGEDEVRSMLYTNGVVSFPFRVLEELWLRELEDVGLAKVVPPGVPPKAETHHLDQTPTPGEGDLRPVHLGKSRKGAWVKLDGSRTKYGYRDIGVLDKPLRTEAAIVAALTVLETSVIEDFDFDRLRGGLLAYVEAHPETREKGLGWVLRHGLPRSWFSARKADNDRERKPLVERLKKLN